MSLLISGDLRLRNTWQPMDPDAAAYIAAVEAADTQALEQPVKIAIDNFVLGCKADGIWGSIAAACILAGARKKEGAFVDLKTATTIVVNNSFLDSDYDRKKLGSTSNTTKYLDTGIADNGSSLPQNDFHQAVWVNTLTADNTALIGVNAASSARQLLRQLARCGNTYDSWTPTIIPGFLGTARNSSSGYVYRVNNATQTRASSTSQTRLNGNHYVFARNNLPAANQHTSSRLSYYSLGTFLNLAAYNLRIADLIAALNTAIP